MTAQSSILAPLPSLARYLCFDLRGGDAQDVLKRLSGVTVGDAVIGFGPAFLKAAGASIPGMRPFVSLPGSKVELPSTPSAVWIWLRGEDRGDLVHETRRWEALLGGELVLTSVIDAFVHRDSRDLSGYEDGTENPTGDDAARHALVAGGSPGMAGSSFVAVQRWRHDFAALEAMSQGERDNAIGRRLSDNAELDDAPDTAHVKRTAQEDFEPEAFVVRRSMPWADPSGAGLHFVAFGRSLDAFDAQLRRMSGAEDGVVDALFRFTRPESGATFWCPPVREGGLDLRAALS